jgi:glycogen operon protein
VFTDRTAPHFGYRFNPHKLVLDPYAKVIGRAVRWHDSLFGFKVGGDDTTFDDRDSAPYAALAAVADTCLHVGQRSAAAHAMARDADLRASPQGLHPTERSIPEALRGTYLGLATEPAIRHLTSLGVTAVELMPVHHHNDEWHLVQKACATTGATTRCRTSLRTLRYASSSSPLESVREFKMMVRALHAAGLEVILDVVYNHTAEGNHLGPTLSLRGIDNTACLPAAAARRALLSGLHRLRQHAEHAQPARAAADHGQPALLGAGDARRRFRFDLASALARELHAVDKLGAFFDIIIRIPCCRR